jgi:thiol-disulfide isomerase/thioredoxin
MTAIALLTARLLLAAVFAVAAATKLADRRGSRDAVVAFGAPARFAPLLALGLPLAELAVAVALLPARSASAGALGALALLLIFTSAIAVSLARGRAPDCHCFGQLHSSPAGWPTLGRNAGLAAVAALIAGLGWKAPGPSAVGWLANLNASGIALVVISSVALGAIGLAAWGLLHALRAYGRLLVRIESIEASLGQVGIALPATADAGDFRPGLPVGAAAPSFALPDLNGETVTLEALLDGRGSLLVFSNPGCGPCRGLMPDVARWQREHAHALTIALISGGAVNANREEAAQHDLQRVLLETGSATSDDYGVAGTPSAVLVAPDGTIASPLAGGAEAIEALLEQGLSGFAFGQSDRPILSVGDRAPELSLRNLNGELVQLIGPRDRQTLMVFWNPECGFCQAMRDDLLAWEADHPLDAPELVIISSGAAAASRAEGFRSPVLLDEDFQAGTAFGAGGTPVGILVDAAGRIASPPAAGAEAVLALAGAGATAAIAG